MKLPALTTGVMSSVTPVWNVCSWVVATVPVPPPVVVRIAMLSPARIVAVRPEIVVMRGSASTRPFPLWMSRLRLSPNEIGERVSGWSCENGGGVPPLDAFGVVSLKVVVIDRRAEAQAEILGGVLVDFEDLGVEHDQLLLDVELIDQPLGEPDRERAAGEHQLRAVGRHGDPQVGGLALQRLRHRRRDVAGGRGRRAVEPGGGRAQRDDLDAPAPARFGATAAAGPADRPRSAGAARVELRERVGDALLLGRRREHRDRVEARRRP